MRESKRMRIVCVKQRHPSTRLEPPPSGCSRRQGQATAAHGDCGVRLTRSTRHCGQAAAAAAVGGGVFGQPRDFELQSAPDPRRVVLVSARQRHTHIRSQKNGDKTRLFTPPHTLCVHWHVCV